MERQRSSGVVVTALAVLSVAGACARPQATEVPAAATTPAPADPWTRRWVVAPGDMAEINVELAAGDTMAATFSADGAALSWNVHSHRGDEAIIHDEGSDATGTLRHTSKEAGMVSFLWMNRGAAPVVLRIDLVLGGTARVHSTHPAG
jgi:hypothetical protein